MMTVAIVGLGYVGLPLAVAFANKLATIGYDHDAKKIEKYKEYCDPAGEVSSAELAAADRLMLTADPVMLAQADIIIVSVPTPVDEAHRPDFGPLISASRTVGENMERGSVVVFESTVYPGATEEICVPVLEEASGMRWKEDFHIAYSPERINPGDKEHTLKTIVKVVAADDGATLESVAEMYGMVIDAGVYRVSSIKVAEAAKVIENTQRDLNIALVNELAIIFKHLDIDTLEVLEAAGTKWNYLPFRPGLVGGHCIGVDPYYLTHKAQMLGYHPQVILAGRQINDGMGKYIAEQTVKQMIETGGQIKGADVIVLGLTFKENCSDLRNSQVIHVIRELEIYGVRVYVHDPLLDRAAARKEYGIDLVPWPELPKATAMVAAVAHDVFIGKNIKIFMEKLEKGGCFIDVKSAFDPKMFWRESVTVWRL